MLELRVRAVHQQVDLSQYKSRPAIPTELPPVDPETGEFQIESFWKNQEEEYREVYRELMEILSANKRLSEKLRLLDGSPAYLHKWHPSELGLKWDKILDWTQGPEDHPRAVPIHLGLEVTWLLVPESLPLTSCSVCNGTLAPYYLPPYRTRCPACESLVQKYSQWSSDHSSSRQQGVAKAVSELLRMMNDLQLAEMRPWARQLTPEQWDHHQNWCWQARRSSQVRPSSL